MNDLHNIPHRPRKPSLPKITPSSSAQTNPLLPAPATPAPTATSEDMANHHSFFLCSEIANKLSPYQVHPHKLNKQQKASASSTPESNLSLFTTSKPAEYYAHVADVDGKVKYTTIGYATVQEALEELLAFVTGELG